MRNSIISTTLAGAALLFASTSAPAATRDHLQCFKIKDPATKTAYTADLGTSNPNIPALEPGCTIAVPAKLYCIDVSKSNVTPAPPGSDPGAAAQSYLCYKAKCSKQQFTVGTKDQFGDRTVEGKSTSLVCAPIEPPGPNCAVNETDCGGICYDLSIDGNNCGMCGHVCGALPNATTACAASTCGVGSCDPGYGDCNGLAVDGCEANTNSDPNNCGSCGHVINDGNECTQNLCQMGMGVFPNEMAGTPCSIGACNGIGTCVPPPPPF